MTPGPTSDKPPQKRWQQMLPGTTKLGDLIDLLQYAQSRLGPDTRVYVSIGGVNHQAPDVWTEERGPTEPYVCIGDDPR